MVDYTMKYAGMFHSVAQVKTINITWGLLMIFFAPIVACANEYEIRQIDRGVWSVYLNGKATGCESLQREDCVKWVQAQNGTVVYRIDSFCGVNFGERIDMRFPDAEFKDNSQKRQYEFSYFVANFVLGNPFRNFREGKVFASMTSRKIYKIELRYEFPRNVAAAVDEAEYRETRDVLKRKYCVECTEKEGFGGDKTNVFRVGDVLITLKFVTEGVIDRGHLILTAENQNLRGVAEAECQKYYQERSCRDVQNMKGFQNGGIDAL